MAEGEGENQGAENEPIVDNHDKPLPYGWSKEITDEGGMVCYRNNITKEIQYEFPTQRARPKPRMKDNKNNAPGESRMTATEIARNKNKGYVNKIQPSGGTRRIVKLCVGVPYVEHYNEQYSDFSEKSSNCKSFIGSIGFHTISICKNGGCMLILLPWAFIADVLLMVLAIILYTPPLCCGCCCYLSEYGKVGYCCLGTCLLRSSICFPCCYGGHCDCVRCLYASLNLKSRKPIEQWDERD